MRFSRYVYPTLLAAALHAAAGEVPGRYVAVISVDGLGARELAAKPACLAERSTIRDLARRGAYSRGVIGVLPTITYPSHATLVTGAPPERHGVIDNGVAGVWFKNRSDIRMQTLWDAARIAHRTVAIVTWPSTYGADVDWLVPEDLTNDAVATESIRLGSTPGLFDALVAATGEPALKPFMDPGAGAPLDEMTARFAVEVVRRHKPQLLLTHFLEYDHRMHAAPYSPASCEALARIDTYIAKIVDAYRAAGILDRTTFFVLSDHGFLPVKKLINARAVVADAGADPATFDVKNAGGSIAFYARGLAQPDAHRIASRVRDVMQRRLAPVRWVSTAQAHAFGGFPGAAFVLCADPGYAFTASLEKSLLLDPGPIGGMHGYCPDQSEMDALFVASGFGVSARGAMPKMPMEDVGPTIAAFIGASLPAASGRDRSDEFRDQNAR
jgi:predicted AlkP superfamily pyrophosphatase or phosphodiesterase